MSWLSILPLGAFWRKGDPQPRMGRMVGEDKSWRDDVAKREEIARVAKDIQHRTTQNLDWPSIDSSMIPMKED